MRKIIASFIICFAISISLHHIINRSLASKQPSVNIEKLKEKFISKGNTPQSKLFTEALESDIILHEIHQRKNPTVYTQGLIIENINNNKYLYESGGLYYKSTLKKMEFPSQKIIKEVKLENKYFAEGIAYSYKNNLLYQLTYKEKDILVYDLSTLDLYKKITMPSIMREGWGLCAGKNENEFYATDGSSQIFILKINNNNELTLEKTITVTLNGDSVYSLNELIYVDGYIYCNKYFDKHIFKINPDNGKVVRMYTCDAFHNYEYETGNLTKNRVNSGDVLNGIAYDTEKKTFLITGKLWNNYYEVSFDN